MSFPSRRCADGGMGGHPARIPTLGDKGLGGYGVFSSWREHAVGPGCCDQSLSPPALLGSGETVKPTPCTTRPCSPTTIQTHKLCSLRVFRLGWDSIQGPPAQNPGYFQAQAASQRDSTGAQCPLCAGRASHGAWEEGGGQGVRGGKDEEEWGRREEEGGEKGREENRKERGRGRGRRETERRERRGKEEEEGGKRGGQEEEGGGLTRKRREEGGGEQQQGGYFSAP